MPTYDEPPAGWEGGGLTVLHEGCPRCHACLWQDWTGIWCPRCAWCAQCAGQGCPQCRDAAEETHDA